MNQVRTAVIQSFISKNIARFLNLILIVIIARSLAPEDLGVYAIAAASILIIAEIKSFGISGILIRKKDVLIGDVQTAIGVTMLISWGLGCSIALSAYAIQDFYGINGIANLLFIQVISFFLSPYISIGGALLQRNFLFKKLTIITVVSQSIKFVVTVCLLLLNFNIYSIALGLLACSFVELILTIYLKPPSMSYKPTFYNMGPFLKFGTFATFGNLFRRVCITIPDLIIGKVGTLSQVAFFSRSIGLLDFISSILVQGITPVSTPYLSKVNRKNENIEEAYNKATSLTGSILLPAITVGAAASYPLIVFMFGEAWIESAAIAAILGIWMFFKSIHLFMPSILLTLGHEKVFFYREFFIMLLSAIAIYIGLQWGIIGSAIGFAIVGIIDFFLSAVVLSAYCKFNFYTFLKANISNIIISINLLLTTYLIDFIFPFEETSLWVLIPLIGLANGLIWVGSLILFSHPLYNELTNTYKKLRVK